MKIDDLKWKVAECCLLAQKSERNLLFGEDLKTNLHIQSWDNKEVFVVLWIWYESKGESEMSNVEFSCFSFCFVKRRRLKFWSCNVELCVSFRWWFSKLWVEQLKTSFWSSSVYTRLGVINFHVCWYFDDNLAILSIWCNRCPKTCLELVCGMFWNVFTKAYPRRCGGVAAFSKRLLKRQKTFVILK